MAAAAGTYSRRGGKQHNSTRICIVVDIFLHLAQAFLFYFICVMDRTDSFLSHRHTTASAAAEVSFHKKSNGCAVLSSR